MRNFSIKRDKAFKWTQKFDSSDVHVMHWVRERGSKGQRGAFSEEKRQKRKWERWEDNPTPPVSFEISEAAASAAFMAIWLSASVWADSVAPKRAIRKGIEWCTMRHGICESRRSSKIAMGTGRTELGKGNVNGMKGGGINRKLEQNKGKR